MSIEMRLSELRKRVEPYGQNLRTSWPSLARTLWPYLALALLAAAAVGGVCWGILMFVDEFEDYNHSRELVAEGYDWANGRATEHLAVAIGGLALCLVSAAIGFALYRRGLPIARKYAHAAVEREAKRIPKPAAPAAPIGHTTDGEPIYPVVGYTPDGKPVTADRAVGVRPQSSGTNGLAVAALILAFVFAPIGAILGFVAKAQINKTGQQGSGLALAGIIIGTVITVINVVAIMVVLGSM